MKKSPLKNSYLNTDSKIVDKIAFEFSHKELLTPTLLYVWNAEPNELEPLAEEIIGRLSPDFIYRYLQNDYVGVREAYLIEAFYELCRRRNFWTLNKLNKKLSGLTDELVSEARLEMELNDILSRHKKRMMSKRIKLGKAIKKEDVANDY